MTVEAIYEPPQEASERGFELLEDDRAEDVAALAALLGLQRVWDQRGMGSVWCQSEPGCVFFSYNA